MFLGYADGAKAYQVWDEEDECIVVTRTVTLKEAPPASHIESRTPAPPVWGASWDDVVDSAIHSNNKRVNKDVPMDIDSEQAYNEGDVRVVDENEEQQQELVA